MAGAFLSNGNVIAPDHDGSAEWNIFWDPFSAKKLLASELKIILFPLDACYQVPVDNYFMYFLKKQSKYKLSRLVYSMLELNYKEHSKYFIWDVLPSMFLGFPDIAHLSNTSIDVELRGTSLGNIFKTSKGSPIHYASWIDDEKFYEKFFDQLKQI
jgi:purine nucleosidase